MISSFNKYQLLISFHNFDIQYLLGLIDKKVDKKISGDIYISNKFS